MLAAPVPASLVEADPARDVTAAAALALGMLAGTFSSDGSVPDTVPAAARRPLERAADPAAAPPDADALLVVLAGIDLPVEPLPEQVARARASIAAGSSVRWVVATSFVLAILFGAVLAIVLRG